MNQPSTPTASSAVMNTMLITGVVDIFITSIVENIVDSTPFM